MLQERDYDENQDWGFIIGQEEIDDIESQCGEKKYKVITKEIEIGLNFQSATNNVDWSDKKCAPNELCNLKESKD